MEILVTGGTGQVGGALRGAALPAGVSLVAPPRSELDLADAAAVADAVAARPWAAVINAGAYTAVDRAESEPAEAWAVNTFAAAVLAKATLASGVPMIQLSTDYVFAGDKDAPYVEDDRPGPLGVYGASKAAAELAVLAANPRSLVVRTSWVVSPTGSNFIRTMLRLGAERSQLRVVDDQHGAPTAARDVAEAVIAMTLRLIADRSAPVGVYHLANAGETTWCGFAREIFRAAEPLGGPSPQVQAIGTADYPTPARRPANSRLSTAKLARDFGITPRSWQAATGEIVRELLAGAGA